MSGLDCLVLLALIVSVYSFMALFVWDKVS